MGERYEIIPGESIGPFRLGMTREEVEKLNIHPIEMFRDSSGADFPSVGVKVHYDESGKCTGIEARVFGFGTAIFALAGRVVNDLSDRDARELFRSISSDIRFFYGCFDLPSVGLRAVEWESSDDFIYAILVELPQEHKT